MSMPSGQTFSPDDLRWLAMQPRRCETRWFFDNELFGRPEEIRTPMAWLTAYNRRNEELRSQIAQAGLYDFRVNSFNNLWGSLIPQPDQQTFAMSTYWLQKDIADVLTGQVEKDFALLIQRLQKTPDSFPATPADLVINHTSPLLEEFLRALPKEDLQAVLLYILHNADACDLRSAFDTVAEKFPWDRPADNDRVSVLGLTMDMEQKDFLEKLLPADHPDLFNNERFILYVDELRRIRYRPDLITMIEQAGGLEDVANTLRQNTPEAIKRLEYDIQHNWNRTKTAQAIAAIVSVHDAAQYETLRDNHAPRIQSVGNFAIHYDYPPGDKDASVNSNEPFRTTDFILSLTLPEDRLSSLGYRLQRISWIPEISYSVDAKTGPDDLISVTITGKARQFSPLIPLTINGTNRQFSPLLEQPSPITAEPGHLLAEADARIRQGLRKLAEKYPQLKRTNNGPLEDVLNQPASPGQINLWVALNNESRSEARVPVLPEDYYSLVVHLESSPPELRRPGQVVEAPVFQYIAVYGQISTSAADPRLAVALHDLVESALTPLKDLDDRFRERRSSRRSSPPVPAPEAPASGPETSLPSAPGKVEASKANSPSASIAQEVERILLNGRGPDPRPIAPGMIKYEARIFSVKDSKDTPVRENFLSVSGPKRLTPEEARSIYDGALKSPAVTLISAPSVIAPNGEPASVAFTQSGTYTSGYESKGDRLVPTLATYDIESTEINVQATSDSEETVFDSFQARSVESRFIDATVSMVVGGKKNQAKIKIPVVRTMSTTLDRTGDIRLKNGESILLPLDDVTVEKASIRFAPEDTIEEGPYPEEFSTTPKMFLLLTATHITPLASN
jgi:hypothetical protein